MSHKIELNCVSEKFYVVSARNKLMHFYGIIFFALTPCTNISLPLDGKARIFLLYLYGYARAHNFIVYYAQGEKKNHLV